MKRLKYDIVYNIVVTYSETLYTNNYNQGIVASSNKRKSLPNSELLPESPINVDENTQMYADFFKFATITSKKIARKYNFDATIKKSDNSNTSYYLTLTHPIYNKRIRWAFFMRLSTHNMDESQEMLDSRDMYYADKASKIWADIPEDCVVDWDLVDIRINNKMYVTYKEAERFLDNELYKLTLYDVE